MYTMQIAEREHSTKRYRVDITGQRFGRLVAIEPTNERIWRYIAWRCQCDCGRECLAALGDLRKGSRTSCGCKHIGDWKHGHGGGYGGSNRSPTYNSWRSIHMRCNNPKNISYPDYGGRGITVCPEWNSFERFLADMGERPKGCTIDRWPDNDGNYESSNCRQGEI